MDLFENVKAYFDKKQDYNTVDVAPKHINAKHVWDKCLVVFLLFFKRVLLKHYF